MHAKKNRKLILSYNERRKHMINEYLERSIQNKIRICAMFQNRREIPITEIVQKTNLSYNSVVALLHELKIDFQGIAEIEQRSSICKINMYEEVHIFELFYSIYSNSNVLKCLKFLITNDSNEPISKFADDNFMTLPTVYRIRKKCQQYLQCIGLDMDKNQIIGEEYRIRFLIALLYYKCGIDCCGIDEESIQLTRQFILSTNSRIDMSFLEFTADEYGYFECLFILSWKRKDHPIRFAKSKKLDELKKLFVYPKLIESVKEQIETKLNINFGKKDYDYIYLIYNCTNNCLFSDQWLERDKELIYEIVFADKEFQSLIRCFENECHTSLQDSYIFQSTMTHFYKKCLFGLQCIIPDKQFYFDFTNDKAHCAIIKYISDILTKWRSENGIKYPFDKGHIYYLAVQFSNIIRKNMPPVQIVILSDIIAEVKTWEIFLSRFFSQQRIQIKSILINAEDVHNLLSLDNAIVIVKNIFLNYLKTLKFKDNIFIIPSSLEINSIEYKEISEDIMKCEQNILENYVEKWGGEEVDLVIRKIYLIKIKRYIRRLTMKRKIKQICFINQNY